MRKRVDPLTKYEPDPGTGCWNWTGSVNCHGYGTSGGKGHAHRVVYTLLVGEIPKDYLIHHECGNKRCVNPEHLTALPKSEHKSHHTGPRAKRDKPPNAVFVWVPDDLRARLDQEAKRQRRTIRALIELSLWHYFAMLDAQEQD